MARTLPNNPVRTLSKEVHRLYRALIKLPDAYTIWYRLVHQAEPGPDFLVVDQEGRVILLKVSHATRDEAELARQPSLFNSLLGRKGAGGPLGKAELEALSTFQSQLTGRVPAPLPALICFPNLSGDDLKRAWLAPGVVAVNRETIEGGLDALLAASLSVPLLPEQIDALRAAVAPEAIVPAALTTRPPLERHREAGLTDFLLDYDQEAAMKLDLELGEAAPFHVNAMHLRLINGVAGSGKSLIILYRARLLRDLFPHKQILVTTHNKALIRDLEGRYQRLGGNGAQTEWRTFAAWCRAQLVAAGRWQNPISPREREKLIARVWAERFQDTRITVTRFQDELDWYKDQLLFSRDDYLQASRRGRGFQLQASMRERVYEAFEAYETRLGPTRMDWGDVPRRTYQLLREGQIEPPQYDVVLVDEAQFFAPLWFEIIKQVLAPQGHLFMVADPTQGFLKRGQSWLASGLEVRGRSERLTRSYRTTRDILDFALRFYQRRLPDEQDEEIVPPALHEMPRGRPPELLTFRSEQDELARLVDEVRRFREAGRPLGQLLVIHPMRGDVREIIQRLQAVFGAAAAADPRDRTGEGHIRVCTLDAVTGLEAPVVFLLGLHQLFQSELDLHLGDEERAELVRDNTRRLYMACTRAGQRLVLCHVGAPPDALLSLAAEEAAR